MPPPTTIPAQHPLSTSAGLELQGAIDDVVMGPPSGSEVIDLTLDADDEMEMGPPSVSEVINPTDTDDMEVDVTPVVESRPLPSLRTPDHITDTFPVHKPALRLSPDVDDMPSHFVFNTNDCVGQQTARTWRGNVPPDHWVPSLEERHADQVDCDRALPGLMTEAGHPSFVCLFFFSRYVFN